MVWHGDQYWVHCCSLFHDLDLNTGGIDNKRVHDTQPSDMLKNYNSMITNWTMVHNNGNRV